MSHVLRLASCRPLPEDDVDLELLRDSFQHVGIDARILPWHDEADWQAAEPTLIRSTWNYIAHLADFRRWLKRRAEQAPLWNPLSVIEGNLHKRYLLELARRQVPTVPTLLFERGTRVDLARIAAEQNWQEIVVKPAIGAASFETHRLCADEIAGQSLLDSLLSHQDMLLQPYLASVEGYGERALVWIAGEFTHAVRKTPRFSGDVEQVSEALEISPAERCVGLQALAPIAHAALYARVDVAPDAQGNPLVMEMELVEPSLFLRQSPAALARLVEAVVHRLH